VRETTACPHPYPANQKPTRNQAATQPLVAEILLKLGQVTERLEPSDSDTNADGGQHAQPGGGRPCCDSTPMTFQIIAALGG